MKLGDVDAAFGIDVLRLEATVTEPIHAYQHKGQLAVSAQASSQRPATESAFDDMISRLGARIGLETITRLHPADSHIPEKTAKTLAAAWSAPVHDWASPPVPRPLLLWRPEPVTAEPVPELPFSFRWRRRQFATLVATGPERISPEWWLDEPGWRSGALDFTAPSGQSCPMNAQNPTPLNRKQTIPERIAFDRQELAKIMTLYGRMVSAGEWRDYGMSFLSDVAVFSIFRRTAEQPIYRIESD